MILSSVIATMLAAAVVASGTTLGADPTGRVARVGFVYTGSPSTVVRGFPEFWGRLRDLGWTEGRNLVIEARWAEGRIDRMPALMNEVVHSQVDIIVAVGTPAAIAARKATDTIPIVAIATGDPVGSGLVASLARPGGNLTGFSINFDEGIPGKWLELLQEVVPNLKTVAVLSQTGSKTAPRLGMQLKDAASARGLKLLFVGVREPASLEAAIRQARQGAQAVVVIIDPLTVFHRRQIADLCMRYRLPGISGLPDFVDVGGLVAYGFEPKVLWTRAAEYVDKILKGAKPGDLPIEQPTKFELVVNLKTAKALGITIPQSILLRADEVIR
jgi:putative ABC transport system substrate-binding protein